VSGPSPQELPVVVLCGGRGTRLGADLDLPKPLTPVGDRPILQHVVELYAAQGAERFLLATGFRAGLVADAVAAIDWPARVTVECVDTGLDTQTGGRVHRLRERLDDAPFHLTYGDGVADVSLDALEAAHRDGGATATITLVRPALPFGVADVAADGRITGFREKPRTEHWINAGFMRLEPDVFDVLSADCVLEREPLERLATDGRLQGHRHRGFWACMDTHKDALALNELWSSGRAPWVGVAAEGAGAGR
jgi:glucose-1-phosphate cytidylyltransferase